MNTPKFKIGDKVVLNNLGLGILFGNHKGLSHMKTKIFTITQVSSEIPLDSGFTHIYLTDDLEINSSLIFSECFDIAPTTINL